MKTNFTTFCLRENLYKVRDFVRQALTELQLPSDLEYKIVLAVDEACSNAIIHGNHCDGEKKLNIELIVEDNNLLITIYDVGSYIEMENKSLVEQLEENIADKKKGGLGLMLIKAIMDEVAFIQEGAKNICQLRKSLIIN